jgi:hypothetical protein
MNSHCSDSQPHDAVRVKLLIPPKIDGFSLFKAHTYSHLSVLSSTKRNNCPTVNNHKCECKYMLIYFIWLTTSFLSKNR